MSNQSIQWGYDDEIGPACWGNLSARFRKCAAGKAQSPVNLPRLKASRKAGIQFSYRRSKFSIQHTGFTLSIQPRSGGSLTLDGQRYYLNEIHFHTPGEHALEGRRFPLEMHLVHAGKDGGLAVVGVFIREGRQNNSLAPVWEQLPAAGERYETWEPVLDAADLLPAETHYYRYPGSLTTPPCSENVTWLVMALPVEMSARQIRSYQKIFPQNSRPLQPLNGREVVYFIQN